MSAEIITNQISESQYAELKNALPLITVLVAGADGKIDSQELNWAEKLTHIRTYADPQDLNAFYEDVEKSFHTDLEHMINDLPSTVADRQQIITKRLARLNDILCLLDNRSAYYLYKSFISFAEHIAKSSGGFLRFGAVSHEERGVMGLTMIEPIILQEIDETMDQESDQ